MIVLVGVWEDVSRGASQEGQKQLSSDAWSEQEKEVRIGGDGGTLRYTKREERDDGRILRVQSLQQVSGKRGTVPEEAQDDRELVARMLAGEEYAFEEFFETHFSRLYRFALPRVGQDEDAAEDVVQSALCKAVSALRSWRGEATLFTWLCTFCRHEISGHYRQRESRPQTLGLIEDAPDVGDSLALLAGRLDRGPDDEAEHREVARQVQWTLDNLPAHYGDALEWKYIQGLSVVEIAARLNIGSKAVESLLTRARQAFRQAFTPARGQDT